MGAPVRLQKAVPRTKENAAVERREARRSALWTGNPVRRRDRIDRKVEPMGAAFRAREFRRSATLCWRGEGFETDNLDGSPPGCAARQRSRTGQQHGWRRKDHREEMTMLKFAHLALHRHARACRGNPRLA